MEYKCIKSELFFPAPHSTQINRNSREAVYVVTLQLKETTKLMQTKIQQTYRFTKVENPSHFMHQ